MVSDALRREYAALARVYDCRWRKYVEATAARTLAALAPRTGEQILDAGCGTGFLLERIAEAAPDVSLTGVDASPDMLARARARPAARFGQADVRQLPFTAASFDAVVISSVLHYLPDLATALEEAARVLHKHGRLVVTDWCGDAPTMRLLAWRLNRRGGAPIYLRRTDALLRALGQAGFAIRERRRYGAGFPWRLTTVSAVKGENGA